MPNMQGCNIMSHSIAMDALSSDEPAPHGCAGQHRMGLDLDADGGAERSIATPSLPHSLLLSCSPTETWQEVQKMLVAQAHLAAAR